MAVTWQELGGHQDKPQDSSHTGITPIMQAGIAEYYAASVFTPTTHGLISFLKQVYETRAIISTLKISSKAKALATQA